MKNFKQFCLEKYNPEFHRRHVYAPDFDYQEEFIHFLSKDKFEVIFAKIGLLLNDEVFSLQPDLKYIVSPTTGVNHIDIKSASKRGVIVISLKGEEDFLMTIKSTAEHTWMLLLAVARNLISSNFKVISERKWNRNSYIANELNEKKIGIIGYGRLGKIVANYAHAFGMQVLIYDNDINKYDNKYYVCSNVDELLVSADYVVLLISWAESNIKFFDFEKFEKMKRGSFFINTSRGEFVDEIAMLDNLKNGKLSGAAIDVITSDSGWGPNEMISNDLIEYARNCNNLIITPHMGGYGIDSIAKTRRFITRKFLNLLKP
jgi:D-3-phosphoglycerate dehydrogenase